MLRQRARAMDADDAVLVRDGCITEATSSNLFMVSEGKVYTPPLSQKLLAGITRKVLLEALRQGGVPVNEVDLSVEQLRAADEIWLTSTTKELIPVTELDGVRVGTGQVGPFWAKSAQLFHTYKQSILGLA